jgi:hypothetical protein
LRKAEFPEWPDTSIHDRVEDLVDVQKIWLAVPPGQTPNFIVEETVEAVGLEADGLFHKFKIGEPLLAHSDDGAI